MGASDLRAMLLAACAAMSAGGGAPAYAQCRLCSTPVTARSEAQTQDGIRLEIESSLDFDRIVLAGSGTGAVVLRPDGSRAAEGAVSSLGARAIVGSATITGEPGRLIRVELPSRIELYSLGGGQIAFDDVSSDLPSLPQLDSAGRLTFRFGGRVTVTGDDGGEYRGDLPIIVEYQ